MRFIVAGAACALTLSLAGCGSGGASDNEVRASMRESAVASCVAASRNAPNRAQYDWPRLCACATDRYMAGKSTSDLQDADPQDPARRAASRQCAIEQMGEVLNAIATGQDGNGAAPAH
jgi:hypothetical protein